MHFHQLSDIASKEILPGFKGKFIHTPNMTFAYWEIKEGSLLPEHHHPHEQVVNLLEGEFEMTIDGTTKILTKGMVVPISGNTVHSGKALTECKILDVFSPVREDYKV